MALLSEWESFYVIVGSSAGALIGLQFVVITLIAEAPITPGDERAGAAFATPTIVHFGVVLLLAGMLSAPWCQITGVVVGWGLVGLGGIIYELIVARRFRAQTVYQPEFEDALFHLVLPLIAYAMLPASAIAARSHVRGALFGVASAALLLLFVGIHNAWDAVMYSVFVKRRQFEKDKG